VLTGAALLAGCGSDDDGDEAGTASAAATGADSTDAGSTGGTDGPTTEYTPVIDQDFPDPDTLLVGDTYWAYATQPRSGAQNVQSATSTDLETWTLRDEDVLPELPAWAVTGKTWAPEVTALGGGRGYAIYFTTTHADSGRQCIGVGLGKGPEGPFRSPAPKPLICPLDQGGAIDAGSFLDDDGKRWLLWKNDGNCCGFDTWLYLQQLSPDGQRLVTKPRRLIKQDQPWEGNLVEAPTLWKHDATYYLLYSANDYAGADYATGYATATSITGPYRKAPEPLLATEPLEGAAIGPGGQDILTGKDGRDRIVFHDWDELITFRGMNIAELTWEDGVPVVAPPD
jgi:beta-xylosidase